ncbi:MAG: hypothetical protein IJ689_03820 [Alphaproteobacteria bacterium]|nr:hypothetical protein [Alphaproteobacteria bacterium]
MKLNVSEYRWIRQNCNLMLGAYKGRKYAIIQPKNANNQGKLRLILKSLTYPSFEEWSKISRELNFKRKNDDLKRREASLRQLSVLDLKKIAALNDKKKLELLDGLVIDVFDNDKEASDLNRKTFADYGEKIKILLLNLKLPPDFTKQELLYCDQFCHRLQSIANLKEYLEGHPLEYRKKIELLENILAEFNSVYQTDIDISALNREKFSDCRNQEFLSLLYKDIWQAAEKQKDWSRFPVVEKLMEDKFAAMPQDIAKLNPLQRHIMETANRAFNFLKKQMQIKIA